MVFVSDAQASAALAGMGKPSEDAPHASMRRLLDFAREATKHLPRDRRVTDFETLRHRLADVASSSAVITNWKARGISREGAIAAEAAFGCSASWLMTGEVPPGWSADPLAFAMTPEVVSRLLTLEREARRRAENTLRGLLDMDPLPSLEQAETGLKSA